MSAELRKTKAALAGLPLLAGCGELVSPLRQEAPTTPHEVQVERGWGIPETVDNLTKKLYDTAKTPCTITDIKIRDANDITIITKEELCKPISPKSRKIPTETVSGSTISQVADNLFVVEPGNAKIDPIKGQKDSFLALEKRCGPPVKQEQIKLIPGTYQGDIIFTKPCKER